MDEKSLDEQMEKHKSVIVPDLINRDPRNHREIEVAMRVWTKAIEAMLNERFGKGNMIYLLAISPIGNSPQISWLSNADFKSAKAVLDALSKRCQALDDRRIILPPEHFGG